MERLDTSVRFILINSFVQFFRDQAIFKQCPFLAIYDKIGNARRTYM